MHYFPRSLWSALSVPDLAKIIVFHGHPHPDEAIEGKTGKWYRLPGLRPGLKYLDDLGAKGGLGVLVVSAFFGSIYLRSPRCSDVLSRHKKL